jgi:hypothetical protein
MHVEGASDSSNPASVATNEPHLRGHYRHVQKKKHRKFLQESNSNLGSTSNTPSQNGVALNNSGSLGEMTKSTAIVAGDKTGQPKAEKSVEGQDSTHVITIDDSL